MGMYDVHGLHIQKHREAEYWFQYRATIYKFFKPSVRAFAIGGFWLLAVPATIGFIAYNDVKDHFYRKQGGPERRPFSN